MFEAINSTSLKTISKTQLMKCLSTVLVSATLVLPAFAQDYPSRDIQFIVPFGAGGGSDVIARNIGNTINHLGSLPVNLVIENRPGGSGSIGYTYLAGREGNPHFVGTVSIAFFTTPLLGGSPVNYENFQPLAAVATDPYIMAVNLNSNIHSLDDLKAMNSFVSGTPGAVSDPALLANMVADALEIQVNVVPFDGGGEVLSNLLGGHIDVIFGNLSEVMTQVQAGAIRPIAVTSRERIPNLDDVPTFTELGHDIQVAQLRGMVMPRGTPDEAITYWENLLREVAESDYWRENYLERFSVLPVYMDRHEFGAEIVAISERYEVLMRELGLIQ
jgi:putative tricarboxylic transport membrane protein